MLDTRYWMKDKTKKLKQTLKKQTNLSLLTVPGEISNSLDMGKKARDGQDDTKKTL